MQGNGIGHQTAAWAQLLPAVLQHTLTCYTTTNEDSVGALKAMQGLRGAAADQLQAGHAEGIAVVFDQLLAARIGLNGQRSTAGVSAHPLDANRAAAGTDIPEQFAWSRRQAGEGDGPNVALGQLAIVLEGRVRQACQWRQARCIGARQAFDGNQVEVCCACMRPVLRRALQALFSRATEVFEDLQATGAEPALTQQRSNSCRAAAIVAQHQQAYAAVHMSIEGCQRTGHH
ncbi:hypothetical protein D3C77_211950 [compost metagenome]